jgi:hypothetical protein
MGVCMTPIGIYSDQEFEADFSIDLGKTVRAEWLTHRKKAAGIVVCHRLAGDIACATSVFWVPVNHQKVYTKINNDPLTIAEDIRCSCGLHGWIREGQWEHAYDSLL